MDNPTPEKPDHKSNDVISVWRKAIDDIDEKILGLINQRLLWAERIGKFKKQNNIQIADSRREKEIMNHLLKKNKGPLDGDGLQIIFSTIIAEGRNVQKLNRESK